MYQFFTNDFAGLSAGLWNWIMTGLCVILLVLLVIAAIRFLKGPQLGGRRGRNARLGVTDAMAIGDERRKLVLVRRDNIEHLLLIGGPSDLVIETNIVGASANKPISRPASRNVQPTKKVEPAVEKTSNTAAVAKSDTPAAPSIEVPKATENPPPILQPTVAPIATVESPAPTASTTATPTATAAVAAVVAPIIAATATENSATSEEKVEDAPQPVEASNVAVTETTDTKLDPVGEMDALLTEISANK